MLRQRFTTAFAIRPPDYATVLKLDQELLDWQSKLPPFFAIHHPDTSLDANHHFLFVQRHLLACEFLFARITLHRQVLLHPIWIAEAYLPGIADHISCGKEPRTSSISTRATLL
jgi:hypothetical protein